MNFDITHELSVTTLSNAFVVTQNVFKDVQCNVELNFEFFFYVLPPLLVCIVFFFFVQFFGFARFWVRTHKNKKKKLNSFIWPLKEDRDGIVVDVFSVVVLPIVVVIAVHVYCINSMRNWWWISDTNLSQRSKRVGERDTIIQANKVKELERDRDISPSKQKS